MQRGPNGTEILKDMTAWAPVFRANKGRSEKSFRDKSKICRSLTNI